MIIKLSLVAGLSEALKLAQQNVSKSQKRQKCQYDRRAEPPHSKVGDRIMVFMPQEVQGKGRKLALLHHGPYCVIQVASKYATLWPVDAILMQTL